MARGRMLNKSVCASLKFNALPDDTCRLMATWLIAHLDHRGVFYADPAMVKAAVFPRRSDIDCDQVDGYLQAMSQAGLLAFFDAKGERWQVWPGFADNQVGLRADRETSEYPRPPDELPEPTPQAKPHDAGTLPDDCRKDAGKMPAEEKLNESKRREGNTGKKPPVTPPAVTAYRENANRYPPKSWYKQIAETVGEKPDDLGFWAMVVHAYVGNGWNPGNAKGMLEFYERREIPASNSKPQPRPPDIISEKRTAGPLPQDVEVKR